MYCEGGDSWHVALANQTCNACKCPLNQHNHVSVPSMCPQSHHPAAGPPTPTFRIPDVWSMRFESDVCVMRMWCSLTLVCVGPPPSPHPTPIFVWPSCGAQCLLLSVAGMHQGAKQTEISQSAHG
uniref:Uncharacterized protein n=1 Tax=Eutreptiella gymnastica TaxID=73025 RepID=A0A7S4FXJ6_9EUGL|mmetsp:Transcript_28329/g.48126  ORF Transcript_28329/g.48126 Transcript_28329/m.48126 type:complete len:125 (-) Transcript_28329:1623-1997(-)